MKAKANINTFICSSRWFAVALTTLPYVVYGQTEQLESFYQNVEENASEQMTLSFIQDTQHLVEDYTRLAQIVLIRHGEPALNKKGGRTRKEAIEFIHAYDTVPVYTPNYQAFKLRSNDLDTILTSTLNRSISTAHQLFPEQFAFSADQIFREFERKIFSFPNIKLPLKWWLTTSRVLWFVGLNKKGVEGFKAAKKRARMGASLLEEKALSNGKTLLVSHGLLNHFLVKYLKQRGWIEVYDGGKGYLSQKLLIKYLDHHSSS